MAGGTLPQAFAVSILMLLILIPYFTFRGVADRLGGGVLWKLLTVTHFARLAIGGGFEDQIGPHAVDDSGIGTNAKSHDVRYTTAIGGKADVPRTSRFCSE